MDALHTGMLPCSFARNAPVMIHIVLPLIWKCASRYHVLKHGSTPDIWVPRVHSQCPFLRMTLQAIGVFDAKYYMVHSTYHAPDCVRVLRTATGYGVCVFNCEGVETARGCGVCVWTVKC